MLGGSTSGDVVKTNHFKLILLLPEVLEPNWVLLSFVVVVVVCAALPGKFQAHPGGEGIMTGLLSSEEEVRAESQQGPFEHFSITTEKY